MAISGRGRFNITTTDEFGNVVPGASVEIRTETGLALTTIFSDRDGLVPITNPVISDANGYAFCYAAIGYYQVKVTGAGREQTLRDVEVGQLSETGPAGPAGTSSGSPFRFDTSTTTGADPGSGDLRLNNATLASVTEIGISYATAATGNPSIENYIKTWDDSTSLTFRGTIIIREASDPGVNFFIAKITSALTDGTTFARFTLEHVDSAGSFSADDELTVEFFPTGDKGIAGGTNTALPKNYIRNPGIRFDQSNAGAAVTLSGSFVADQWEFLHSQDGTLTAQTVASPTPGGSPNRLRVTVTAADGFLSPTEFAMIRQKLEGTFISDLQFGSASAVDAVVRFGFKGPAGKVVAVGLRNDPTFDRTYIREFTCTGSDQVAQMTFPGAPDGTWATGASTGIALSIALASGSTFHTTAGAWQTGSFIATSGTSNGIDTANDVFELFDVGMYADPNSTGTAPDFVLPPFDEELAALQRYLEGGSFYWLGSTTNGANHGGTVEFKTPKRVAPTVTQTNASVFGSFGITPGQTAVEVSSFTPVRAATATGTGQYQELWLANARM